MTCWHPSTEEDGEQVYPSDTKWCWSQEVMTEKTPSTTWSQTGPASWRWRKQLQILCSTRIWWPLSWPLSGHRREPDKSCGWRTTKRPSSKQCRGDTPKKERRKKGQKSGGKVLAPQDWTWRGPRDSFPDGPVFPGKRTGWAELSRAETCARNHAHLYGPLRKTFRASIFQGEWRAERF